MAVLPRAGSDVIVGPSRYLPWPLDAVARRSWDEGALFYRRYRHVLPAAFARVLSESIERIQRPTLSVFRSDERHSIRVVVAANDPLIRASLFAALGGGAGRFTADVQRAAVQPDAHSELAGLGALDVDVVAFEIPSRMGVAFARAGWLVLPRWVALDVELGTPEHELWDARKRETVRKIERSGLELEIARGAAAADEFHRYLYAPTALARHRDLAIVVRPGHVAAAARCGFFVFVREGSVRRAGLLAVPRPGRARAVDALLFGVRGGEYGATALAREAAYLFALRWARDVVGAARFGLTAAAPFLRDGILRFKSRWGATASADERQPACVAVRIRRGSPELCRALALRPPLVMRYGGAATALGALAVRIAGEPAPDLPRTRGVEVAEVVVQSPGELPRRIENFAKGG